MKGTEGEANEDQDTGALGVRNTCVDVTDRGQRPILLPPVTIDYSGACYGVTYNPSDLGAIRPDSAWDLANIEDSYKRCTIGDALWRAGVLPAAPYGYYWTGDYTLAPAYYY